MSGTRGVYHTPRSRFLGSRVDDGTIERHLYDYCSGRTRSKRFPYSPKLISHLYLFLFHTKISLRSEKFQKSLPRYRRFLDVSGSQVQRTTDSVIVGRCTPTSVCRRFSPTTCLGRSSG